jgi:predicted nucleic acid-binding protein
VLDSTAIAALFFKDPYSDRMDGAIKAYDMMHTLDLAYSEVANVAWKRACLFGEQLDTCRHALELAEEFMQSTCNVIEARGLVDEALRLGFEERIAVYDSLFLAAARRNSAKVLTTDEKLHAKVQRSKELHGLTLLPDPVQDARRR